MAGADNSLIDPDVCERILHAALTAGDIQGVKAALIGMAIQDPHRAQRILDTIILASTVAESAGRCGGCGRSGGELTENGCPTCEPRRTPA